MSPSSATNSSSVTVGPENVTNAEFQAIEFLSFSPQGVDGAETTEIKLLRELEFENYDCFQKNAQEMVQTVTTKPTTLIFIVSSDTLNEARQNPCNGDFLPCLGLDLRAPQLEQYHSGFRNTASVRAQDIRFSAGTANIACDTYKAGVPGHAQVHAYQRRPNLVYYRYELGKKRSIYLFTERRFYASSLTPQRDRSTIEAIEALRRLSASPQGVCLHPFWVHMVILYHVIDTRNIPLERSSQRLFAIEAELLDRSLIKMGSIGGFSQHIQDLHEILRSLITLEYSNEKDILLIGNLLADLGLLSTEASALGAEYKLDANTEARLKSAFLFLRRLCADRTSLLRNRKQRAQNIVELLYNLTTNRDSITSLEIARKNADIARDTKKDSESMNTIAILTLLYLPATFVCSFFGTNFFTLEVADDGHKSLFVSELCWVYFVSALILTGVTVAVWLKWLRRKDKPDVTGYP